MNLQGRGLMDNFVCKIFLVASKIHWGVSVYFLRDKTVLFLTVCHVVHCVKNNGSIQGIGVLPVVGTLKSVLQTVG
jgi:hypothetical protein